MNFENSSETSKKTEKKFESGKPREIQFKPITDGLGFHPFSDGLPYAAQTPVLKKLSSSGPQNSSPSTASFQASLNSSHQPKGSGAISAGRPTFVTRNSTPLLSNPSNAQYNASFTPPEVPTSRKAGQSFMPAIPQNFRGTPVSENTLSSPSLSLESSEYGMSYVCQRVFGYVIDTAFNVSVAATILSFALIQTDVELLQTVSDSSLILSAVFIYLSNWAAIAGQEVAFGTSLGKRVFGLSIPGSGSDAFIRAVAFIPATLLGGLGILSAIFDSQKRCWHDRFARVQPTVNA